MIGEAREKRQEGSRPKIDPKDYVFSEETVKSLTELALLVRDIRARQAARQAKANTSPKYEQHSDNNHKSP